MKNIFRLSTLTSLLFLILTPFLMANDWRFWNNDSVQGKLNEKLSVKIEGEFRFKDDMSRHYYSHADITLTYSIIKWFDTALGYRKIYSLKTTDWVDTNYPHINGTIKWNWTDWKLSDRVRLAYPMPEGAKDYWELRNLFIVISPWKITPLRLNPYASDEVFYNFCAGEWSENRAVAGILFPIFLENINGKIYYMYNSKKNLDKWDSFNNLGTEISLKF